MRLGSLFPERTARTLNQTVKVCAGCNNGWMSRLETAAKPVLERLLTGSPLALSVDQQHVVAQWFVKNAVLHDWLLSPPERTANDAHRRDVRHGRLPVGWQVLLGALEEEEKVHWSHRMGARIEWRHADGSLRGRCVLHTTAFEALAAQVVLHNLDEEPTFDQLLGGPGWAVRIAPARGPIAWPPPRKFTQEWLTVVGDPSAP